MLRYLPLIAFRLCLNCTCFVLYVTVRMGRTHALYLGGPEAYEMN